MKTGFLTLAFLSIALILSAQQLTDSMIVNSTIQKKIFIVRKFDAKEYFKQSDEIVTDADSEKSNDKQAIKTFISLPKMTSDKEGLLNQVFMEQHDASQKKEYEDPYAILSITVSEFGFISKIVVHDYSDKDVVDIILQKFDQTKWKAAMDNNGMNSEYTYHKIAVIMPVVIKPENHEH